ncbi:unnamed protein product [Boreogadus saida]
MINHMISLPFDRRDERHVEAGAPTESVSQEASRRLSLNKPLSACSLCLPVASVCLQRLSACSVCLPAASVCLQRLSACSLCLPLASVSLQLPCRLLGSNTIAAVRLAFLMAIVVKGDLCSLHGPAAAGRWMASLPPPCYQDGPDTGAATGRTKGLCSQQPVEKKRQGPDGGAGAHQTPLLAPCPGPPRPAPTSHIEPLYWPPALARPHQP